QAVIAPLDPGYGLTIVEAKHQLHVHGDLALYAAHDAYDVHLFLIVGERHEVRKGDHPFRCLEPRLEYRCVRQIATSDGYRVAMGTDFPATMLGRAQQRSETGS